jgi:hypothetical protein
MGKNMQCRWNWDSMQDDLMGRVIECDWSSSSLGLVK